MKGQGDSELRPGCVNEDSELWLGCVNGDSELRLGCVNGRWNPRCWER